MVSVHPFILTQRTQSFFLQYVTVHPRPFFVVHMFRHYNLYYEQKWSILKVKGKVVSGTTP
jgi:hypothetical protein